MFSKYFDKSPKFSFLDLYVCNFVNFRHRTKFYLDNLKKIIHLLQIFEAILKIIFGF